jgi:protein involved in polysaccharide export with SLBB domain
MRSIVACLCFAACANAPRRASRQDVPGPVDVTLGPADVFEVRVYGEPDLSGTYRVDVDGTIDFPLVGRLVVAGQVPSQIATLLTERLAQGYLKSPQVSILVKEYNSKKVTVIGQVQKPGTFPYLQRMSVVEAVSLAGGFTSLAAANDVVVRRGAKTFTVRAADIAEGKGQNFYLEPGDTVLVPERMF